MQKVNPMKFLYVFITAILLTSCGASVAIDYDKKTDFDTIKTFQFYKAENTGLNDLDNRRIEIAIDSSLVAKGWQLTDYNQFYIKYYVNEALTSSRNTLGIGVGSGGGGISVGGGVGIPIGPKQLEQELTIEVFQATTNEPLVWQGSLVESISERATPEQKEAHFTKMVFKILAKFPPEKK